MSCSKSTLGRARNAGSELQVFAFSSLSRAPRLLSPFQDPAGRPAIRPTVPLMVRKGVSRVGAP